MTWNRGTINNGLRYNSPPIPFFGIPTFCSVILFKGYGSFVYIIADIEQLAAADVFVGTFSSNVGRLVAVLREGLGKTRNSSISLDAKAWYPGRSRGLLFD